MPLNVPVPLTTTALVDSEPFTSSVPSLTLVEPVNVWLPDKVNLPAAVLVSARVPAVLASTPLKETSDALLTINVAAPPATAVSTVPLPVTPGTICVLPFKSNFAPPEIVMRLAGDKE